MTQLFSRLFQAISTLRNRLTQVRIEDSILSQTLLSEQDIREKMRAELRSYYESETLRREYANATLERFLQYGSPEKIALGANEQLSAHVILTTQYGQRYEVDIFYKIGETYTLDDYYNKIAAQIKDDRIKGVNRSQIVRDSTIEANWYIQRWTPNTPVQP